MIQDFVPVNSLFLGISKSTLLYLLGDPGVEPCRYFACAICNDVVPLGDAGGTLMEEGIFSSCFQGPAGCRLSCTRLLSRTASLAPSSGSVGQLAVASCQKLLSTPSQSGVLLASEPDYEPLPPAPLRYFASSTRVWHLPVDDIPNPQRVDSPW